MVGAPEHSLRRKWWLWPVLIASELVLHEICAKADEYLLEHLPSVAPVLAAVSKSPIQSILAGAVLILTVLAVHSYFAKEATKATKGEKPPTAVELAAVKLLWASWESLLTMYERLDYDNRQNTSTRFPFNHASWPGFGEIWSHTHITLFVLKDELVQLQLITETFVKAFEWNIAMPDIGESVVMIDFLREAKWFQEGLYAKKKEYEARIATD